MAGDSPISWLMFFTLAAGVFIIAGAFIMHLRSRTNREIAADALAGQGSRHDAAPHGAAPELIAMAVAVFAVMALLATGYSQKSSFETAQKPGPVGTTASTNQPSGTTTGMAQQSGTPDQPKKYQPANPAPDTRAAPTSSETGVGNENGTTGQPAGPPK